MWLPPSFRSERVRDWLKERVIVPMWGRGPDGMVQGWRLWGAFSTHQRHHNCEDTQHTGHGNTLIGDEGSAVRCVGCGC